MDIFQGAILGIVEGLTEFLPISSSGHLILARELLGINISSGLATDAVLQLASVLAVGVYFFRDLWNILITGIRIVFRKHVEEKAGILFWAVIFGTIPGVILGLLLESYMQTVFRSAFLVACTLALGSLLFFLAEKLAKQDKILSKIRGFWVGCFQALALVPGISRSGATISGGLMLGLTREEAARFSFVLSFPIILGSGLKKLLDLWSDPQVSQIETPLIVGSILAFSVGLACIHFLIRYLRTHSLNVFAYYRLALSLVVFLILFVR